MDVKLNPPAAELLTANAIFAGRARQHYVPPMAGPHSIKAVLEGRAIWNVDGRSRTVTPDRCLAVNEGETYSLTIESATPVQTCCAFFAPGFLESVKGDASFMLDANRPQSVELASRYEEPSMRGRLIDAWQCLEAEDALGAEAAMLDLAAATLDLAAHQTGERHRIEASRPATRAELFRRLNIARDFIFDNLGSRLTLDEIAGTACLAPFHFHRLFRSCYGMPVSQFVREERMRQAAKHLRLTEDAIDEIALASGYESPTAFTRAFHRRFGVSPRAYRAQFRKNGEVSGAVDRAQFEA